MKVVDSCLAQHDRVRVMKHAAWQGSSHSMFTNRAFPRRALLWNGRQPWSDWFKQVDVDRPQNGEAENL